MRWVAPEFGYHVEAAGPTRSLMHSRRFSRAAVAPDRNGHRCRGVPAR